ncbi:serine hydrolase [Deinococcus sp. Arct2-2]|uniref:serine hydrolase n=1 Tax=Deinococcus sp. Arct2-2 TaxID=2568653 RepID=UPI001F0E8376|nr:serine hydrolase [Deinococcus sp. Arct2-2]
MRPTVPFLLACALASSPAASSAAAAIVWPDPPELTPLTCVEPAANGAPVQLAPTSALPVGVSGRVAFSAIVFGPDGQPLREMALGDVDALHPLASTFKPLVVEAVLRDIDAGKLKLNTLLETTPGRRSIESYPAGENSIATLAKRALVPSDNTASDLLHLTAGVSRVAREVHDRSPCTSVLHTTKAMWALQSGLLPDVLPNAVQDAPTYAALPFSTRLDLARLAVMGAQRLTGPQVEAALDVYFKGPSYTPDMELGVQNTSTARAFARLQAQVLPGATLNPASRALFRGWLSDKESCCKAKTPTFKPAFWGVKSGSGWRMLTMSGAATLKDGRTVGYALLIDGADPQVAEETERWLRPLAVWIDAQLLRLTR